MDKYLSNCLLWDLVEKILAEELHAAERSYAADNVVQDYRRALRRFNDFILDGQIPADLRDVDPERVGQMHVIPASFERSGQYIALGI